MGQPVDGRLGGTTAGVLLCKILKRGTKLRILLGPEVG